MKHMVTSQRSALVGWVAGCLLVACAVLAPAPALAQDPLYGWTKRLGGPNTDVGRSVAVDSSGNVYIAGHFGFTSGGTVDFAEDFGDSDIKASAGIRDIYITRLNADGSYGWTKRLGGIKTDEGEGVAVDAGGNVYVTGSFQGTVNFAADFGGTDSKKAFSRDIFLTRLNPDGSYGWTRTFPGHFSVSSALDICVDAGGNVYLTGFFNKPVNFAADFGGNDLKTPAGIYDIFVTRINSDGSYGWTKRMGGSDWDQGDGIAVDSSGNVYVSGYFGYYSAALGMYDYTVDFAADFGGSDLKTLVGHVTGFITRINADGSYGWTKRLGRSYYGNSNIGVDSSGNVYVAGSVGGGAFDFAQDFGGTDLKPGWSSWNAFVTRINADGTYAWTKILGKGDGYDEARGVAVDANGNVYVTGTFYGTANFAADFGGSDSKVSAGGYDVFVTRINADSSYGWTRSMGGTGIEYGYDISANSSGNVYVTGSFQSSPNFAADFWGSDAKASAGVFDIFVTQIIDFPDADQDGLLDSWENTYACMAADFADAGLDYDSDGLDNAGEYTAGTDPCNPDTDGDRMTDGWEASYSCVDPLVADWHEDPDGDGKINWAEFRSGFDPCVFKSLRQDRNGGSECDGPPEVCDGRDNQHSGVGGGGGNGNVGGGGGGGCRLAEAPADPSNSLLPALAMLGLGLFNLGRRLQRTRRA